MAWLRIDMMHKTILGEILEYYVECICAVLLLLSFESCCIIYLIMHKIYINIFF
jgi:hypothetical protein